MSGQYNTKLIQLPRATSAGVIMRGTLVRDVIDQVNRNTIALGPPRGVTRGALSEVGEQQEETAATVDIWTETSKTEETVEVDGVEFARRTQSTFTSTNTGLDVVFLFDNT